MQAACGRHPCARRTLITCRAFPQPCKPRQELPQHEQFQSLPPALELPRNLDTSWIHADSRCAGYSTLPTYLLNLFPESYQAAVNICVHAFTLTYLYTYIPTYMHSCTCIHTYRHPACIQRHACLHAYMHTYMQKPEALNSLYMCLGGLSSIPLRCDFWGRWVYNEPTQK